MSYETLDTIADVYIPLLLGIFIVAVLAELYKSWPRYQSAVAHVYWLTGLLVVSYGIMFFDNATHLWPSFGLDYSTHTAVSLSLVLALCVLFSPHWVIIIVSMLAYCALMMYQEYHSFMDIFSTSLVILIFAFGIYKFIKPNKIHNQAL